MSSSECTPLQLNCKTEGVQPCDCSDRSDAKRFPELLDEEEGDDGVRANSHPNRYESLEKAQWSFRPQSLPETIKS
jgi:hypothetical protein